MSRWRICPTCPEGDNEWPAECFTAAGTAFSEEATPCNDCFLSRYPARRVDCTGCGRQMKTRGKCPPMCRPCRRAIKEGRTPPAPVCPSCGRECEGVTVIAGECASCYQSQWRSSRNVNGKQRIGAWKQAA